MVCPAPCTSPGLLSAPLHHNPFQIKQKKEKCKYALCGTSTHSCRTLEHRLGERRPGARHERSLLPCLLPAPIFSPTTPHLPGVAPGLCLPPSWPSSPTAAPWQVREPAAFPQDPAAVVITHIRCQDSAGRSPSPEPPYPPGTAYDMNIAKARTSFFHTKIKKYIRLS